LKSRAWQRGLRLAADMVPNHVGVDGEWVMDHPNGSPIAGSSVPVYRFSGPDLSEDREPAS